ncbi:hypothetical protein HOG21_01740 [bacterium]|jgi:hypothetical protein|nr:hypothetical protein [bacterium]
MFLKSLSFIYGRFAVIITFFSKLQPLSPGKEKEFKIELCICSIFFSNQYLLIFILLTSKAFSEISITKQLFILSVFFNILIGIQLLQVHTSIKSILFLPFSRGVPAGGGVINFNTSLTITSVSFLGINTLLSTKKSIQ